MDKKILTIIVSYNALRYNWLYNCIDSIKQSAYPTDVFFIDNGSDDASCDVIKSYKDERFILFETKKNLGFGQANNIGLKYAIENNYDFVFLLNQDAYLKKDTLEKLISLPNLDDYGIISPIQYSGTEDGIDEDFLEFVGPRMCANFLSDGLTGGFKNKIYDCNFVMAASWFLPIATLIKVGGFSPEFFHYGEDENYCHRVLYHNLKIGILPSAGIYHDRKKSQETFFNPIDGPFRHHMIRILNPLLDQYKFRNKGFVLLMWTFAFIRNNKNGKKVYSKLYSYIKNKKKITSKLGEFRRQNESLYLNS
ncbi:glycosyltransferase family 2 protein [Soonwooa purpurea]